MDVETTSKNKVSPKSQTSSNLNFKNSIDAEIQIFDQTGRLLFLKNSAREKNLQRR